jgi:hypothetical protein
MIEYIETLEAQQGTGTWQQKTQDGRRRSGSPSDDEFATGRNT